MRRIIANSLVDTFMKYHEDRDNYTNNQSGFDMMYAILDKYGDASEDVGTVFQRATPEDQQKMIEFITPNIPGVTGYSASLYQGALMQDRPTDYEQGILDAFQALLDEGIISEEDVTL